ncbi:zinc-ribbon domain-containing protein [Pleionea sediminis]|uniref:zinc-ribbon domain-containing protein n=1 Tax=Pleionea sediminis TaxID=2569479 RepID=UPI001187130C|nr:zinc-ribbon domain-containing protein [Pleionea sediminis]
MKSGKQRRLEIKAKRREKAKKSKNIDRYNLLNRPVNSILADHSELSHVCGCRLLPLFYVDKPFVCIDCGSEELWTAKQQKWWYEIAKGHIDSIAVRCRPCRKIEQRRKAEARRVHLEGIKNKLKS